MAGIEGDLRKLEDVHPCIKAVDASYLILAEGPYAAEYSNFKPRLHRLGELHDLVCGIGPVDETASERGALAKLEQRELEWIEFLSRRIVKRDSALNAWREIGDCLAHLLYRVVYIYSSVPIPEADWTILNRAIDGLPSTDRTIASSFLSLKHRDLKELGFQILEAYGDIRQYLSRPDRPDAPDDQGELNSSPVPPTAPSSSHPAGERGTALIADDNRFSIQFAGKTCVLSNTNEYKFVKLLVSRRGKRVSHQEIADDIIGDTSASQTAIRNLKWA